MKIFDFILEYGEYIRNINSLSSDKDIEVYNNFKNTIIVEGLIKTHPNNTSLDIILKRYPELTGNIEIDGEIYLEGNFRELSNYLPIINNLGYFISTLTLDGKEWSKNYDGSIKPIALFLEPKYDTKIIKYPPILYHSAPLKYKISILHNGLVPKSHSKLSNHPDRIYLTDEYKMAYIFGVNLEEPFIICEIDAPAVIFPVEEIGISSSELIGNT